MFLTIPDQTVRKICKEHDDEPGYDAADIAESRQPIRSGADLVVPVELLRRLERDPSPRRHLRQHRPAANIDSVTILDRSVQIRIPGRKGTNKMSDAKSSAGAATLRNIAARLFSPVRLGRYELKNRIVMAPLTRNRAGRGNVPQAINVEYYAQRASAGLIITEATRHRRRRPVPGLCRRRLHHRPGLRHRRRQYHFQRRLFLRRRRASCPADGHGKRS